MTLSTVARMNNYYLSVPLKWKQRNKRIVMEVIAKNKMKIEFMIQVGILV